MQVNVKVSPDILDWVMTHIHLDRIPVQIAQSLSQWRNGEITPTYNQIEKASCATGIPLGYFFLKSPPKEELPLLEYRTIDSLASTVPSRNLIDVMHDMEQVQAWAKEYAISTGDDRIAFIGSQKDTADIYKFASDVRSLLGITEQWFAKSKTADDSFRKIRDRISASGALVMMSGIVGNNTHRPLSIEEFRAFTMIDDYAPLIFINANDSINGKLFSLIHEYAHICIGANNLFNDRYSSETAVNKAETVCNAVAAEILVPTNVFVGEWQENAKNVDPEGSIKNLVNYFKCGSTVIARRALDNGFIDYPLYQKIAQIAVRNYDEKRNKDKGKAGGGNYYRTAASRIDRRFFKSLLTSVAEGKTLYSEAFRLTNTNRSSFRTLAETFGVAKL